MSSWRHFWNCLGVWAGLFSLCSFALAQPPIRLDATEHAEPLEGPEFAAPPASSKFYYGVMGQIARPGVYELNTGRLRLMDLLRDAGGLTRRATNEIHIVRDGNVLPPVFFSPRLDVSLVPGDIVVADGPLPNEAEKKQVALVGLLNRPVILPVPAPHANLKAIVAYLGQPASLANEIQVEPVGGERIDSETKANRGPAFLVPTVLYVNSASIQADQLPPFPEVYRIGPKNAERLASPTEPTPPPELAFPPEDRSPVAQFSPTGACRGRVIVCVGRTGFIFRRSRRRAKHRSAGNLESRRHHRDARRRSRQAGRSRRLCEHLAVLGRHSGRGLFRRNLCPAALLEALAAASRRGHSAAESSTPAETADRIAGGNAAEKPFRPVPVGRRPGRAGFQSAAGAG